MYENIVKISPHWCTCSNKLNTLWPPYFWKGKDAMLVGNHVNPVHSQSNIQKQTNCNIKYLDVSFGNTCQLLFCSPDCGNLNTNLLTHKVNIPSSTSETARNFIINFRISMKPNIELMPDSYLRQFSLKELACFNTWDNIINLYRFININRLIF